MKITVKIQRLDSLIKLFNALPDVVAKNLSLAMQTSLGQIASDARARHKFTSRSGHLEMSVREKLISKWPPKGRVELDEDVAPYAPFIHEGTGLAGPKRSKYPIIPKRANWLRWTDRNTGKVIFARKVMHPGVPVDQFLYEAANKNRAEINAIFNRYTNRALREGGF